MTAKKRGVLHTPLRATSARTWTSAPAVKKNADIVQLLCKWHECGTNAARMWHECGTNAARMWHECGTNIILAIYTLCFSTLLFVSVSAPQRVFATLLLLCVWKRLLILGKWRW